MARIPSTAREGAGRAPCSVPRPFGTERADLDIDFALADPPALVSALLARAGHIHPWEMTVSARIAGLAELAAITEGAACLLETLRCAHCGEQMEVNLPVVELMGLACRDAGVRFQFEPVPGTRVEFRPATGRDQQAWRAASTGCDPYQMASRLAVSGWDDRLFNEQTLERLSEAFEEHDPLVAFRVEATCPNCGASCGDALVDLQAASLRRLRVRQRELLNDVHRLALAYHWTEADVFELPASRRMAYLDLLGWPK